MKIVEQFKDLIDHYEYKQASKIYYKWAYKYLNEFNIILNERNIKRELIVDQDKLLSKKEMTKESLIVLTMSAVIRVGREKQLIYNPHARDEVKNSEGRLAPTLLRESLYYEN